MVLVRTGKYERETRANLRATASDEEGGGATEPATKLIDAYYIEQSRALAKQVLNNAVLAEELAKLKKDNGNAALEEENAKLKEKNADFCTCVEKAEAKVSYLEMKVDRMEAF